MVLDSIHFCQCNPYPFPWGYWPSVEAWELGWTWVALVGAWTLIEGAYRKRGKDSPHPPSSV